MENISENQKPRNRKSSRVTSPRKASDTRTSNTGVRNTCFSKEVLKNCCKIDYLAFTLWSFPLLETEVFERNRPRVSSLTSLLDKIHDFQPLPLTLTQAQEKYYFNLCSILDSVSTPDDIDDDPTSPSITRWTPQMIPEFLGLADTALKPVNRGLNGYKKRHTCGLATILSEGSPEMGLHVILSGDALDDIPVDALTLIRRILATGGSVARIDIAIDDFEKKLNLNKMMADARAARCRTRMSEIGFYESINSASAVQTGLTMYVGSRSSDIYFRYYDKRLESIKSGISAEDLPSHWVRGEIEVKGRAAKKLSALLVSPLSDDSGVPLDIEPLTMIAPALFRQYMTFCAPSSDPNRSRWKPAKYWTDFLETDLKISLSNLAPKTDMDRRRKWFSRCCATTMVGLMETFGPDAVQDIYMDARTRLSDELQADMQKTKYKLQQNLPAEERNRHENDRTQASPEPEVDYRNP